METTDLDALIAEFRAAAGGAPDAAELERFREFLLRHGGLRVLAPPGLPPRLLASISALRCFHFSQYLDWYLAEKIGIGRAGVEAARPRLSRFNEWLRERQAIGGEAFEENRESIAGGGGAAEGEAPGEADPAGDGEGAEEVTLLREERDFYVPGEYSAVVSGEFVLTHVEEGMLYGRREEDGRELGPILVDRAVSSGHRIGDRVHLALGRAGDHWNLLRIGPRA